MSALFSGKYIKTLRIAETATGVNIELIGDGKPIKIKKGQIGMAIDNSKASVTIKNFFLVSGKRLGEGWCMKKN